MKYLLFLLIVLLPLTAFATTITGTPNVDTVNVRKEPSIQSNKLGEAKRGQSFGIIGEVINRNGDKWYLIELSNGKRGYISAQFMDIKIERNTPAQNQTTIRGTKTPVPTSTPYSARIPTATPFRITTASPAPTASPVSNPKGNYINPKDNDAPKAVPNTIESSIPGLYKDETGITFELRKDNTCIVSMTVLNKTYTAKGKWSYNNGALSLDIQEGFDIPVTPGVKMNIPPQTLTGVVIDNERIKLGNRIIKKSTETMATTSPKNIANETQNINTEGGSGDNFSRNNSVYMLKDIVLPSVQGYPDLDPVFASSDILSNCVYFGIFDSLQSGIITEQEDRYPKYGEEVSYVAKINDTSLQVCFPISYQECVTVTVNISLNDERIERWNFSAVDMYKETYFPQKLMVQLVFPEDIVNVIMSK